jgi:cytochrome c oxidase assembly protein subunit 15
MDGQLLPPGYGDLHPFPRNLTENIAAVQFDHRLLATLTLLLSLGTLAVGWPVAAVRGRVVAVGGMALLQYTLGVATLLLVVPVDLAALHQAGAAALLTAYLVLLHGVRSSSLPEPQLEPPAGTHAPDVLKSRCSPPSSPC